MHDPCQVFSEVVFHTHYRIDVIRPNYIKVVFLQFETILTIFVQEKTIPMRSQQWSCRTNTSHLFRKLWYYLKLYINLHYSK